MIREKTAMAIRNASFEEKPHTDRSKLLFCPKMVTSCARRDVDGEAIKHKLTLSLSHLPIEYFSELNVILKGFSNLGADTFENVNNIVHLVAERIVETLLKTWHNHSSGNN